MFISSLSLLSSCPPPGYLSTLCQPVSSVPGCRHLRSARRGELDFPRVNLATYGGRAFAYVGPISWNSLPDSLKDINLTLQTFKRHLKTFLFLYILAHSARLMFLTKTRYINPLLLLLLFFSILFFPSIWEFVVVSNHDGCTAAL